MAKTIMGVQLISRIQDAAEFQNILSKYGCIIQTRIGLHGTSNAECSPSGVIVLDLMENADEEIRKLEKELSAFENVRVQKMVFESEVLV